MNGSRFTPQPDEKRLAGAEDEEDQGSQPAFEASKLSHRRSVSLPENIEGLDLGNLPPLKSKKKLKLPSLSSLFNLREPNEPASHDKLRTENEGSSNIKHHGINGLDSTQRAKPNRDDVGPSHISQPLETPSKSKQRLMGSVEKENGKSSKKLQGKQKPDFNIFPWRQKKHTDVTDLEECFDAKSKMASSPGTSQKSLKNNLAPELSKKSMRESRPIRKSMSLNDLDLSQTRSSLFGSTSHLLGVINTASNKRMNMPVKNTGTLHVMRYKDVTFVNEYALICTLGRGSFGKVKLALSTMDSELYALKLIPKRRSRRSGMLQDSGPDENIQREIDVMKSLNHPNVIRLVEVIDDPLNSKMLLVMEYAEAHSLAPSQKHYLTRFTEIMARRFFRDVLAGLDYLHTNNVAHGDLKPENLLMSACGAVKIADLGSSHFATGPSTKTRGTPAFMAPEMCSDQPFDPMKADIWALGACLYSFVYGCQPFKGANVMHLYNNICTQPINFLPEVFIGDSVKHLLRRLLEKDPAKRISLVSAMNHPWITHNGAYLLPNCRGLEPDEKPSGEAWLLESWPIVDLGFKSLISSIEDLLEHRTFKAGEYIVKQGDVWKEMFYVKEGEVEIIHFKGPDGDSDDDDLDEEDSPFGAGNRSAFIRTPSTHLRHVFHATRSAHQMLPSDSIKRLDKGKEGSIIVARRGRESVLLEAQDRSTNGVNREWQTSIVACGDVELAVIGIPRLKDLIDRRPGIELDVRSFFTQRLKELQKLDMLETLARLHADIEDEVCVNGVCPLWTRDLPEKPKT